MYLLMTIWYWLTLQTAKCGTWVDEAHQPVAKIRTSLHQAGQKSAPIRSTQAGNPHQSTKCKPKIRTSLPHTDMYGAITTLACSVPQWGYSFYSHSRYHLATRHTFFAFSLCLFIFPVWKTSKCIVIALVNNSKKSEVKKHHCVVSPLFTKKRIVQHKTPGMESPFNMTADQQISLWLAGNPFFIVI